MTDAGNVPPVSGGSTYFLSEEQIATLSAQASAGDSASAFRLYKFYIFSNFDSKKANSWLEIAARNGNAVAQYNLAKILQQENKYAEALCWAHAADSNGESGASQLADELERQIKATNSNGR
ncbi:sel1 repeat family protein [Cupriavidus sp. SK-4]|uniref:sel1 repeat family protein n=1 Tax=Cupriavidus sp. SK-4 TaxID=574750 RepID=UPI0012689586|nr:sel1 repeat family protein [Cupriavidus sp. SK-4]